MKSYIFGLGSLALLLLSAPFACSNSTDDCRNTSSCVPTAGGGSGSAEAGEAGASASDGGGMGGAGQGEAGQGGGIGSAGEAGTAGASGAAGGEAACDVSKSPSEESCLVSDEYAVFVAPTGKDGASGTQAGPVKTIEKALQLAGDDKMVIACDGTYDEQLTLTTGARLYGGFACPGNASAWTYEAGKKAKIAPSSRGVALSIASSNSAVVIQDCEFDAKDGIDPGQSSVAAFVNTSNHVELTRVKLVAGSGADGENGTLHKITTFPTQAELNGRAASGDTGGAFNLRMCPAGGSTTGAVGGNGGPGATGGGIGVPALGGGTAGTLGASCGAGGTGQDGASALPTSPALGAGKIGSITQEGWSGTAGGDGTSGGPGQGGGGGAGAATGGGGGGGGAGGCGGPGGSGGKAGGSSIALLLLNSSPTLSGSELVSASAGKGGNGAPGQDAQPQVGNGGLPDVNGGCAGGKGGAGAAGAAGGGGAGGISVGIAYRATQQSSAPVLDATTIISTGPAGIAGSGGILGTNDGIAGMKKDVLYVP